MPAREQDGLAAHDGFDPASVAVPLLHCSSSNDHHNFH
jgi:hypothetical protein